MARDMTPRQVAEAYLAAWNAHDADAAAALMADEVTYFDVIVGKPQKGRDAARDKVIKLFVTAAPDLTFKMTGEPIESANGIAYEFTFAGTNTGAWGPDTPATGKPFSFNGVTFMRVENGKIVYQGDWYDSVAAPTSVPDRGLLLALSRRADVALSTSAFGAKADIPNRRALMSANDPKRTCASVGYKVAETTYSWRSGCPPTSIAVKSAATPSSASKVWLSTKTRRRNARSVTAKK